MKRLALLSLSVVLLLVVVLAVDSFRKTSEPEAQDPGPLIGIAPGAVAGCHIELATATGTAINCPFGDLRGFVNIEGGTHAYETDGRLDHGKLRFNISPGVAVDRNTGQTVREVIALSPAPGGGTVMFAGTSVPIASFVPDDSWWPDKGITFYRRPLLKAGLLLCNGDRCFDVARRLRSLARQVRRLRLAG